MKIKGADTWVAICIMLLAMHFLFNFFSLLRCARAHSSLAHTLPICARYVCVWVYIEMAFVWIGSHFAFAVIALKLRLICVFVWFSNAWIIGTRALTQRARTLSCYPQSAHSPRCRLCVYTCICSFYFTSWFFLFIIMHIIHVHADSLHVYRATAHCVCTFAIVVLHQYIDYVNIWLI